MYVYVLYVFHCIVWIVMYCMYCMNMLVLHVYMCISCIVCIVCIGMYLHVLHVFNVLYECVCIVCMSLYIIKYFYRYIHIHAHTYIHTIQTKYRYVANVCMCMYFWHMIDQPHSTTYHTGILAGRHQERSIPGATTIRLRDPRSWTRKQSQDTLPTAAFSDLPLARKPSARTATVAARSAAYETPPVRDPASRAVPRRGEAV